MSQISRCIAALLIAVPVPLFADETEGAWSELFDWPVTAIHMNLLHTGHILLWSNDDSLTLEDEDPEDGVPTGQGEPYLLDPTGDCFDQADGCFTPKPNPVNLFCGGHAQLSDGSVLVNGGHVFNDVGLADTFLFEYDREANDWNWTERDALPDSHFARWYSTLTTLPDGRILNVSGSEKRCGPASESAGELCEKHVDCGAEEGVAEEDIPEPNRCLPNLVAEPEVFDPATREWTLIETITNAVQYYPFNFVAPNGEVYFAGADTGADTDYTPGFTASNEGHFFNVDDGTFQPSGQDSIIDGGSAVMYRPGQILKCGGSANPDVDPDVGAGESVKDAEIIDLNGAAGWTKTGGMNSSRRRHNLTLLPDGTVLATGGTQLLNREFKTDATCGGTLNGTDCATDFNCRNEVEEEDLVCVILLDGEQQWVAEAEIWDPNTGVWTVMAPSQSPRLYHSTALLLPDGRVVSAGGGPRGFGRAIATYTDAQIYSPPYLFRDSERPVINDAPEIIYYGNAFEVFSEQAHDVAAVNLVRLGAVTHSFDQNSRFVPLSFSLTVDDRLDVQAPPNGAIAPPGYYMLFLISSDGFPSVAQFVRILPPNPGANMLYEYTAKVVCGRQGDDVGPQQRTAGRYATSVNIHNPLSGPVRFFKKFALTSPPGMQQPGRILPIGEDVLQYDEALQTDCRELRQKLIPTSEEEVIEGFLVIQSPTSLDVTSVYTTAALGASQTPAAHSSIDVEQVVERKHPASDLLIEKTNISCPPPDVEGQFRLGPCDFSYTTGALRVAIQFRLFEVVVTNLGPDRAEGVEIADELHLEFDTTSALGATAIWGEDPIDLPPGTGFTVSQPDLTRSRAQITLPDLDPGLSQTLRFWTLTYSTSTSDEPINLVNRADLGTTTVDLNSLNNSAAETVSLHP